MVNFEEIKDLVLREKLIKTLQDHKTKKPELTTAEPLYVCFSSPKIGEDIKISNGRSDRYGKVVEAFEDLSCVCLIDDSVKLYVVQDYQAWPTNIKDNGTQN